MIISKYTPEQYETAKKWLDLGYSYRESAEKSGITVGALVTHVKRNGLVPARNETLEDALDVFSQGKVQLADKIVTLTNKAVKRAIELVDDADNIGDVKNAILIAETVARMHSLVPKETQVNVQVNAVVGFEFVPVAGTGDTTQKQVVDVDIVSGNTIE